MLKLAHDAIEKVSSLQCFASSFVMDVVEVSKPSHPEGPLAQTISGVLSISYNDSQLRHAFDILDAMPGSINERSIRSTVETNIIKSSRRVLDDFESTYESLVALGSTVKLLESKWAAVDAIVTKSTGATASVVAEARKLHHEQQVLRKKLATADAFAEKFVVSERESEVLSSSTIPVDEEFYTALTKVKHMNEACAVILAESPESGEHIMHQINRYIDQAYDKLKFSVEHELRADDAGKTSASSRRQIALLADRPLLLREVLSDMATMRRKQLYHEFMNALSNKSLNEKPLDYYMFDPVRYVGGVLAWVHSAIVNEYEYVSTLLDPEATLSTRLADGLFVNKDAKGILLEVIDGITGTLNQPLRLRFGQLISGQSKLIMVDEITNIFGFYRSMMAKYEQKTLTGTFEQLDAALDAQFDRCLLLEIQEAQREKASTTLSPPDFWISCLATAKAITKSYEQSMSYDPTGDDKFRTRIGKVIDPFYQRCATLASGLEGTRAQIFLLNCFDAAKLTFAGFVCTAWKSADIDSEIERLVEELANLEYNHLLTVSGLDNDSDKKLMYQKFGEFLKAGANIVRNPELVSSPQIVNEISTRASLKLLAAYENAADADAPYTLDEIRILIQ